MTPGGWRARFVELLNFLGIRSVSEILIYPKKDWRPYERKFLQKSCFYRLQYWVKPLNLSAPICDFNGPRANFKKLFSFGETSDRHAAYIFRILRQFWTKPASVYLNFFFENFLGRALINHTIEFCLNCERTIFQSLKNRQPSWTRAESLQVRHGIRLRWETWADAQAIWNKTINGI